MIGDYRADMALRRLPLETRCASSACWRSSCSPSPLFAATYWLNLANQIAIATIGALGLNILVGYTGQISMGQGAFMAVGAYSAGILGSTAGIPFWSRSRSRR